MGALRGGDPTWRHKLWKSPAGITVAFIGAIAEDVPTTGSDRGTTFTDPIKRIDSLAAQLKSSGTADIVVRARR